MATGTAGTGTIPLSGRVLFPSDFDKVFGTLDSDNLTQTNRWRRFNSLYGIAAGVSNVGIISLGQLRGASASTPAAGATIATQVKESSTAFSASLDAKTTASITDTYGAPLRYTVTAKPTGVEAAVDESSGSVTYSTAASVTASGNIVVNVTNRFGRAVSVNVPVNIGVKPAVADYTAKLSSVTKGEFKFNVAPLFSNPSAATMSYVLVANPKSSAALSSSNLTVTGNYRETTYDVSVSGSNVFGTSGSNAPVAVTETAAPSPTATSLGSVSLSNNTTTYTLSDYFTTPADTTPLSYYITANPNGNATLATGLLSVVGANRGSTYNVTTSASNAYGKTASSSVSVTEVSSLLPAFYTSSSEYLIISGWSRASLSLKTTANYSSLINTRTYTMQSNGWNIVHDRDLDSNVYYYMPEAYTLPTKTLYKVVLSKRVTTVTTTSLYDYTNATSSVLGATYAPKCMGSPNGAFLIGGFRNDVVHVLEFNSSKTGISYTYTVPYKNETYGIEVIPKAATNWANDYAVAYTRTGFYLSSWNVDMATRTWSNLYDINFVAGISGPENGCGVIYYPAGKAISSTDSYNALHRIAMYDTSSTRLYIWRIAENGTQLTFTFQGIMTGPSDATLNGYCPIHLSVAAYNTLTHIQTTALASGSCNPNGVSGGYLSLYIKNNQQMCSMTAKQVFIVADVAYTVTSIRVAGDTAYTDVYFTPADALSAGAFIAFEYTIVSPFTFTPNVSGPGNLTLFTQNNSSVCNLPNGAHFSVNGLTYTITRIGAANDPAYTNINFTPANTIATTNVQSNMYAWWWIT